MTHLYLPFLAPLMLLLTAALAMRTPGLRPGILPRLAEWAGLAGFAASGVAAAAQIAQGPGTSGLIGAGGIGLSVRLDAVSATMGVLVSFIGWVVLRYSATAMDGEARQGAFTGWMAATLAMVLLLVSSGNLVQLWMAWVLTSLSLHQLLLHYPDRATAQRAARKRTHLARGPAHPPPGTSARSPTPSRPENPSAHHRSRGEDLGLLQRGR